MAQLPKKESDSLPNSSVAPLSLSEALPSWPKDDGARIASVRFEGPPPRKFDELTREEKEGLA